MSRKVVFLSLLVLVAVVVLAGCLPRGRADLPNVPAGPAVVDEAQGGAEQVAVPGSSGELRPSSPAGRLTACLCPLRWR